jgi:hypothetical protein
MIHLWVFLEIRDVVGEEKTVMVLSCSSLILLLHILFQVIPISYLCSLPGLEGVVSVNKLGSKLQQHEHDTGNPSLVHTRRSSGGVSCVRQLMVSIGFTWVIGVKPIG